MTQARALTVLPDQPGWYHVVSRCVRRAWLLGLDQVTGRNCDHRKDWIEERIVQLAEAFAVGVYAYAVMSNHIHLVLRPDPALSEEWEAEDVIRRWFRVCKPVSERPEWIENRIQALISNDAAVAKFRERLGSISWFMRLLSEPIARASNAEDEVTGRFWEGRFKCQALLDDAAVLSAMVYVDLNPVRAKITDTPETSPYTSIRKRCDEAEIQRTIKEAMGPIAGPGAACLITTAEYLELVDFSGRIWREDKSHAIPSSLPPILRRIGLSEEAWLGQVKHTRTGFYRAIGSVEALMERAEQLGQRWLKGINLARRLKIA